MNARAWLEAVPSAYTVAMDNAAERMQGRSWQLSQTYAEARFIAVLSKYERAARMLLNSWCGSHHEGRGFWWSHMSGRNHSHLFSDFRQPASGNASVWIVTPPSACSLPKLTVRMVHTTVAVWIEYVPSIPADTTGALLLMCTCVFHQAV